MGVSFFGRVTRRRDVEVRRQAEREEETVVQTHGAFNAHIVCALFDEDVTGNSPATVRTVGKAAFRRRRARRVKPPRRGKVNIAQLRDRWRVVTIRHEWSARGQKKRDDARLAQQCVQKIVDQAALVVLMMAGHR